VLYSDQRRKGWRGNSIFYKKFRLGDLIGDFKIAFRPGRDQNMNLVFISSPQTEFESIRKDLCYLILTDPYLKQYFDVFLFENIPANERDPRNIYLDMVEEATIYLGLLGQTYGSQDEDGISPTEHEYNHAVRLKKDRILFLKDIPDDERNPEMARFIQKIKDVTYTRFSTSEELKRKVIQSLLFWQQNHV
jgi:hypothetical protein